MSNISTPEAFSVTGELQISHKMLRCLWLCLYVAHLIYIIFCPRMQRRHLLLVHRTQCVRYFLPFFSFCSKDSPGYDKSYVYIYTTNRYLYPNFVPILFLGTFCACFLPPFSKHDKLNTKAVLYGQCIVVNFIISYYHPGFVCLYFNQKLVN